MDTIMGMQTFVAAVAEGSFAGAAARLGMSPQLVSKYIGQLERRLGARLLNRTTRRLSITEAGQAYYQRSQHILAEIDEMENAIGQSTVEPRGTLKINAPMSFGVTHLAGAVASYQRQHREVSVDLNLDDRVIDVVSEGYDLAIRIGRLDESSLVARKIAPVRMVVCGSPEYLSGRGTPKTPDELATHECLCYTYSSSHDHWLFEGRGKKYDIKIRGKLAANNGDALREAAIAGAGLMLQPSFIVSNDIRAGRLRVVLEDFNVEEVAAYAVYAHRQYLSAKVRTFVDFLPVYFGFPPYWDKLDSDPLHTEH